MNKEEEKKNSNPSQDQPKESSPKELSDEQLSEASGGTNPVCSICHVPIPCACIP